MLLNIKVRYFIYANKHTSYGIYRLINIQYVRTLLFANAQASDLDIHALSGADSCIPQLNRAC
jgi:hypothetical protein